MKGAERMNREKYEADIRYIILKDAIENALDEIYREKEHISFDMPNGKEKWVNSGVYDGLEWAEEIIKKHIAGVKG